jgi:hypothetical protein
MEIPPNVKITETPLTLYWFDEQGILHSYHKDTPVTLEKSEQTFEILRKLTKNRKVCIMLDVTHLHPQNKETKEQIERDFPQLITALAVISKSVLGKIVFNILVRMRKKNFPMKMFLTENDARKWLKQFCNPFKPSAFSGNGHSNQHKAEIKNKT